MIRFRIQELMAEKTVPGRASRDGLGDLCCHWNQPGDALKMINQRGYSTVTDTLDKLCAYFNCPIEQLAEYIQKLAQLITTISNP